MVSNAWDFYGLSLPDLENLVPRCVGLTLGVQAALAVGLDFGNGIDRRLLDSAKSLGRPVFTLENVAAPFEAIDANVPLDEHFELLFQASYNVNAAQQNAILLTEAWFHGRAEVLAAFLEVKFKRTPQFKRSLITDRNQAWLPKLEQLILSEIPVFIAVGVLHTVGPESILKLLGSKGLIAELIED